MKDKKSRRSLKNIKVPLVWRGISLLSMVPLGIAIFLTIFRKSGGKFPLTAGDSTDPYFFGAVFAVLIPLIVYIFIIDKILKGVVARRKGADIAKDVAADLGKAAAEVAVQVVLDSGSGGSSSRSSSSGGTKGGGGEFGGGGASGGY